MKGSAIPTIRVDQASRTKYCTQMRHLSARDKESKRQDSIRDTSDGFDHLSWTSSKYNVIRFIVINAKWQSSGVSRTDPARSADPNSILVMSLLWLDVDLL